MRVPRLSRETRDRWSRPVARRYEALLRRPTTLVRVLLVAPRPLVDSPVTRVLVISPDRALEEYLKAELDATQFAVGGTRPGGTVARTARRARADVVVIDRVEARHDAAALEIAVVRDVRPDVRVVLVSRMPSCEDAPLVAEGVFFYLAASPPVRLPDVVRAAARAVREEAEARQRQGELR